MAQDVPIVMTTTIERSCCHDETQDTAVRCHCGYRAAVDGRKPLPAFAASLTFSYGSLANDATDAQIQTYMNGQLGANGSVIVTGAIGSNSYNADGHVTGPVTNFVL